MKITERKTCRSCGQELPEEGILNMGMQTIVDFPLPGEKTRGEAPVELVCCGKCGLLQLRHTVEPDVLYKTFWYRSGMNEQMKVALHDLVQEAQKRVALKKEDFVLDIGCNDGTTLGFFPDEVTRVGFDPATELVREARQKVDGVFFDDYFNAEMALKASNGKPYKVVLAIAMFYDLEDPGKFLEGVWKVLDAEGVFIIQMNYLGLMLRNMSFDNIVHEHLCYYSLATLNDLCRRKGFSIVDVEQNGVNGGSIRVYLSKITEKLTWRPQESVKKLLAEEKEHLNEKAYIAFGERVRVVCQELRIFLGRLKRARKVVYAYGASTRGATLLQTVLGGMDAKEVLAGVAERDEKKFGRRMAGLDLEIVPEKEARAKAGYFLVLPWHFWNSIAKREYAWMMTGGRMILPLPYPRVVEMVAAEGQSNVWFPQAIGLGDAVQELVS